MSEAHDRKSKRILQRDWEELRVAWIDNVPSPSEPGGPPESLLVELPELDARLASIRKDQVDDVVEPIPGLRSGLLHESVYLLHKAAHVFGAAQVHVSEGMCTWSLSSAYQAAFFSMKAVMGLLGVVAVESNNRHFLIDVWGTLPKPRRGVKGPITVLANTGRNEQRNLWAYFQRTLGKTLNAERHCHAPLRAAILDCEYNDFGRQRNGLHYRTNVWGGKDLHVCVRRDDFGRLTPNSIDPTQEDFSLLLGFGLLQMGRAMLADLAVDSRVLLAELALVDDWLNQPFNELYHENLKAIPVSGQSGEHSSDASLSI